jgi:hypothetical protein
MKNALKYAMLVLALASSGALFASLVGLASPSAFIGAETGLWLYASAGLMLISLGDGPRRLPAWRKNPSCQVIPFSRSADGVPHEARAAA